jgi:hypothetical protein
MNKITKILKSIITRFRTKKTIREIYINGSPVVTPIVAAAIAATVAISMKNVTIYRQFNDVPEDTNLIVKLTEDSSIYRVTLNSNAVYNLSIDFSDVDFDKGLIQWRTFVTVNNLGATVVSPNGGSIYYFTTPNYVVPSLNQTVYTQWEAWVDVLGVTNIWSNQYEVH